VSVRSDLRDALVIARREFLERAQSKWFVAITLLGPLGMVALVLLQVLIASSGVGTKVDILDRTGVLAEPLAAAFTQTKWKPTIVPADTPDAVEMAKIRDKQINGFVSIPSDGVDGGKIVYRGDNGSNLSAQAMLQGLVAAVVQAERGKRAGIAPAMLATLFKPPDFVLQQTDGKSAGASGAASYWLGYALAYIVFIVILLYGVSVMRSVVQEKTTRVMELMVATVKPRSLMAGKILGVGGAGLLQVGVWLIMGAVTLAYRNEILGLFGKTGGESALPTLAFGEVAIALLFFIFGYFFYSSMYAAVGAMVSSEQDTQQVQMPVTVLMLIGFTCFAAVTGDPRGSTATVVTMLPFWSPLLMPMRYLIGGASGIEVAISVVILVVSTVLVARAAAKIYRVGVLMYGKRPNLQELIRWLRY
jgi:ABC-2 type transport system permease protein